MALLRRMRLCFLLGVFLLGGMQAAVASPILPDNELNLTTESGGGNAFSFTLVGNFDSFSGANAVLLALDNLKLLNVRLPDGVDPDSLFIGEADTNLFFIVPMITGTTGLSGLLKLAVFDTSLIDPASAGSITVSGDYDYQLAIKDGDTLTYGEIINTSFERKALVNLAPPTDLPEAPVMLTFATGLAMLAYSRRRMTTRP